MIKLHEDESGPFLTLGNSVYNPTMEELIAFHKRLDLYLWEKDTQTHNENIKQKS